MEAGPHGELAPVMDCFRFSRDSKFQSPPFKFVVGEARKEFWLHKDLISKLSKPLNALINGPWREAREGSVEWDDIDEETFRRFIDFVYTRDYRSPAPEIVENSTKEHGDATSPESRTLFVGNIPYSADEMSVSLFFEPYAAVEHVRIPTNVRSGHSKGLAFVTFKGIDDAKTALQLNGANFLGRPVRLDFYKCCHGRNECRHHNGDGQGGSAVKRQGCPVAENDGDQSIIDLQTAAEQPLDSLFSDPSAITPGCLKPEPLSKLGFSIKTFLYYPITQVRDDNKEFFDYLSFLPGYNRCARMKMFESAANIWLAEALGVVSAPREDNKPNESFENIFLAHARLYALGDRYMIPTLKKLAAAKLAVVLFNWVVYPERIDELAELVRYVYANTVEQCRLRRVVKWYAAALWYDLRAHAAWKELVDEEGAFAQDMADLSTGIATNPRGVDIE
ncbi:hypothetical protein QBC46DRAFT_339140 [Diplogelasinospora grovesii]|uniref:RRM domain-containing protein n=1 Tax=Diplogelasinospora grovesii TaxID=303347 RepID=A0AAN6S7G9_9PEZI|nr:hypothetical protein QBC46DRAFT_339140 [Diplogelasinospora grovesii]